LIDTETFQTFMPQLHSAFVEDLNDLPGRIDTVMSVVGLDEAHKPYIQGLSIAFQRGLDMRRGAPPAVALAQLINVRKAQLDNDAARRSLQVIGLLAREYAAGGGEPFIQELANRDRGWLRRYFVALIARDAVTLDPAIGSFTTTFMEGMRAREADAILLLNQMHSVQGMLREFRAEADSARRAIGEGLGGAGSILRLLQAGERFLIENAGASPQRAMFQQALADATTLHQAFSDRDYGSIVTWLIRRPELRLCSQNIVDTSSLLQRVRGEAQAAADEIARLEDLRDEVRRGPRAGRQQDPATLARRDRIQARQREKLVARAERRAIRDAAAATRGGGTSCQTRLRYLSFAASLAAARNAEEVTLALQTASAPVGSFRAKRNQEEGPFLTRWGPGTVSIMGYPGVTFGWERTDGGLPSTHDPNHAGVSLPVGVELSWGSPLGAFSLFAPILDLGGVLSARFNDDGSDTTKVSSTPKVGFQQVFAPGIYLMVNAKNWPVSVGFGFQSIEDLREREITSADGTVLRTEKVDVVRASLIFGVDATLFNFRF
jgi:hypothetical protein